MDDIPLARVRVEDGEIILDDPEAMGLFEVVAQSNCLKTAEAFRERVEHFIRRVGERRDDPRTVVVVLAWVDDVAGSIIAEALMPGTDWQEQRDKGMRPYARGLAERGGIERFLAACRPAAAEALKAVPGLAVVVIDHGTAAVFPAEMYAGSSTS